MAQLVAAINTSSRSIPLQAPPDICSSDSLYIRNLAPSYGRNSQGTTSTTGFYGEESICEQLAKKYGITPAKKVTPRHLADETIMNSADMSLATAQYFERHSIGRKKQFQTSQPIVDFAELEKLQNFK